MTYISHPYLHAESEFVRRIPNYVARESQIQMASLVDEIIKKKENGMIEAGTGMGKTFAYLMPLLHSGKKAIISTGTKNLQDQLFYKDIPFVNRDINRRIALLKGRSNYLCKRRLRNNLQTNQANVTPEILRQLVEVNSWSESTRSGDLTEFVDTTQSKGLLPLVTSSSEYCTGNACDFYDQCAVYKARNRAREADIVVVNHHLLFSDIVLQDEKIYHLLPAADVIIVDEAHQISNIAAHYFGEKVSTGTMFEILRDLNNENILWGGDDPSLIECIENVSVHLRYLVDCVLHTELVLNLLLGDQTTISALDNFDMAMGGLTNHLNAIKARSEGFRQGHSRVLHYQDMFTVLTEKSSYCDDNAHWIERYDAGFSIFSAPVEPATKLSELFEIKDKSWIFVSATMSVNNNFQHAKKSLGLHEVTEGMFSSPFNYQQQVRAYVPPFLPNAGTDRHSKMLLTSVLPIIRETTGRIFFLFTSHRALERTAALLAHEYDITFLVQGALPKKKLLEKFITLPNCVLLATHSFWEGVDVRGANLKCLIIDKLPFTSPEQPLFKAQCLAIEAAGGNSFDELSLPEAAIALKQGFGRLIRQESDLGLFILGDNRINTKTYGTLLRTSLPKMTWYDSAEKAMEFVREMNP